MAAKKQAFSGIRVVGVGKGWLAVDKPAGMSVHNVPGQDLCSYISEVVREDAKLQGIIGVDSDFGVNPVHRLDKETSGVILLTVSPHIFRFFARQFESHQAKKTYIAILHGRLAHPEGESGWGTWDRALSKAAAGRDYPQGPKLRQESETRYHVMDYSEHYTMVELELLSGRTHQIRRHAKLAGHPVVGDSRYGSTRAIKFLKQNAGFDRLALHARSLTFQLPGKKGAQTVESKEIPAAMAQLFESDKPPTI